MPDAIVIGGGVMGLGMARALRRRGLSVTLLERGQPGRAASWASAGIIGATVREESDPSFRLRRVSEALWPAFALELLAESGMDPEYRETGCLYLAFDQQELAWLGGVAARAQVATTGSALSPATVLAGSSTHGAGAHDARAAAAQDHDAGASSGSSASSGAIASSESKVVGESSGGNEHSSGLAQTAGGIARWSGPEVLDGRAVHDLEPALAADVRGALLVAGGNVEVRRLCRALELAARRSGVEVVTGADVRGVRSEGDRVTGVETADGVLGAEQVVLAAGAWCATIKGVQPVPRVRPQRGQIMAIDQASVGVRHVLMTPGDPYFVPRSDGRLVVGATREEAGWDPSMTVGGVAWLLERAMQVVPALKVCPIAEIWTGFRPLSEDGLPFIGRGDLRGLYFLTGHGPSGISPLPGSVALLDALMSGTPPPLPPEPFDPLRA